MKNEKLGPFLAKSSTYNTLLPFIRPPLEWVHGIKNFCYVAPKHHVAVKENALTLVVTQVGHQEAGERKFVGLLGVALSCVHSLQVSDVDGSDAYGARAVSVDRRSHGVPRHAFDGVVANKNFDDVWVHGCSLIEKVNCELNSLRRFDNCQNCQM